MANYHGQIFSFTSLEFVACLYTCAGKFLRKLMLLDSMYVEKFVRKWSGDVGYLVGKSKVAKAERKWSKLAEFTS